MPHAVEFFLFSAAVQALPEIAISKHRHADVNPARLRRRQNADSGGTVETNSYDILTWSAGGAYYANGESLVIAWHFRGRIACDDDSKSLAWTNSGVRVCLWRPSTRLEDHVLDHARIMSYHIQSAQRH
jgi:hypothetical protein